VRAGARIGARAGDIVSARIPVDALPILAADPAIRRIEAAAALRPIGFTDLEMLVRANGSPAARPRRHRPFELASAAALANDIGADEVRVHRLRQRVGDRFLGLAGQGVIIGVYDTGLDLSHADFRDADGRPRVLYAWDQSAATGTPPGRVGAHAFDYGHECTAATIDLGACPMVDAVGHGTHVAGTAAGTGAATGNGLPAYRYAGVAPAADLIVVKGGDGGYTTDRALDGVAYIFERAAELGRPAVVVLSFATQAGPHDGSTAFEQALDSLAGPGRIIVAAAGNGGYNGNEQPPFVRTATHAHGRVTAGGSAEHALLIPPYSPNPGSISDAAVLELWYDGADSLSVTVVSPRGDAVTVATGDTAIVATPGGAVYIDNAAGGPDPGNGDHQAFIILFDSTETAPPDTGRWTIRLRGDAVRDGTYHLWLTGYSFQNPTRATLLDPATNAYLVGSPGTAGRAITVAAYTTRHEWSGPDGAPVAFPIREPIGDIAFFSAPGPRRDGVLKPELAAPGKFTISARASDGQIWREFPTFVEADGAHAALLGTSQAAPHVAGAAALLLQLQPHLGPEELRELLTTHARRDAFALHPYTGGPDGSPNPQWGHGKLDVERAVHAIGLPAGSVALDVQPLPAPERIQSARGTRVPLLSITAETDSVEAVAIVGLGFELGGKDPGAQLLLVQDVDGDGVADPGEPVSAAIPAPLDGTPRVVRFQAGPVVPAGTRQTFLLMLELSGAAPNGARFSARYLPAETRTRGTISGAEDRFSGAASPVDSGEHVTTVLAAEERFNLSENPVRGASLTINYEERPRAAAVYTIAGQRVRDLGGVLGERSATWDLRNDRGSPVASGAYYLVIEMPGSRIVRKIFVVRP
jgi:subtilisin family serine protease